MMTKKRGISTFIATLLLMVLAVSAGVVIYAYTMGYLGGYGGTDTLGGMSLDQGKMMDDDTITVYMRNIGSTAIDLDPAGEAQVYVDGIEADINTLMVDDGLGGWVAGTVIPEGEVGVVGIIPGGTETWDAGKTYQVKIIAVDNTQVSFNLKCEVAPP